MCMNGIRVHEWDPFAVSHKHRKRSSVSDTETDS